MPSDLNIKYDALLTDFVSKGSVEYLQYMEFVLIFLKPMTNQMRIDNF